MRGVAEGLISGEAEGGSTYCPSLSVRRELTFHEYKMAPVKMSGSRGDLGNNYGGRGRPRLIVRSLITGDIGGQAGPRG